MALSDKTAAALAEIEKACAQGCQMIAPVIITHFFGRAASAAAFRIALRNRVVEIAYTSAMGTPVYRPAGTAAALEERKAARLQ